MRTLGTLVIIPLVVAVASGVIVFFLVDRGGEGQARLEVRLLSDVSLLSPEGGFDESVQVLVNDERVVSPRVGVVTITNLGTRSIEKDDFDVPVSLCLDEGRLVVAEIAETLPPSLPAALLSESEGECTTLARLLLNAGDLVTIRLLVDGTEEISLIVTGHVRGIPSIEFIERIEAVTAEKEDGFSLLTILAPIAAAITAGLSLAVSIPLTTLLSRPRLCVEIGPVAEVAESHRFIHLKVRLTPGRWPVLPQRAAHECAAFLDFVDQQSGQVILSGLPADWSSTPEPLLPVFDSETRSLVSVLDSSKIPGRKRVDLRPGDTGEDFAVALKHAGEEACYAFNHENYFAGPGWKLEGHKLPHGQFLVRVRLESSDSAPLQTKFLLKNTGSSLSSCYLEPLPA